MEGENMRAVTFAVVMNLVVAANPCVAQSGSAENAVRQADSAWSVAASSNDVDRMLSFYDKQGAFVGTNPATIGNEALRALWTKFFTSPGYHLSWKADRVEVAAASDLAYSFGQWEQTTIVNGQPRTGHGIYVAVWRKQPDGTWKVLVDKP
jgi:ketosteroid isomerase-like protein